MRQPYSWYALYNIGIPKLIRKMISPYWIYIMYIVPIYNATYVFAFATQDVTYWVLFVAEI